MSSNVIACVAYMECLWKFLKVYGHALESKNCNRIKEVFTYKISVSKSTFVIKDIKVKY